MEKKYEGVELPNPKYFKKDEKLLKNLKKIFKEFKVNTSIDKEGIYFVPKITLLKGEKAVLKLIVKKLDTIKEDDLLSFEFKENEKYKKCFKLSYKEITIGELIKNQRIFEIECTEEFASEAPIFLEIKIKDKRCGVLQIYPNNKENIKRISIILIKIGEGNIKK